MKARRRTTESTVEVIQWVGIRSLDDIVDFVGPAITAIPLAGHRLLLLVGVGTLRLADGDWLVRDMDVLSVCSPSTFGALYEFAEDEA